jgi:hypothetical protein
VEGFLARASSKSEGDLLFGLDQKGVAAWLDQYCKAQPLDDMMTASDALVKELEARSTARNPP